MKAIKSLLFILITCFSMASIAEECQPGYWLWDGVLEIDQEDEAVITIDV